MRRLLGVSARCAVVLGFLTAATDTVVTLWAAGHYLLAALVVGLALGGLAACAVWWLILVD